MLIALREFGYVRFENHEIQSQESADLIAKQNCLREMKPRIQEVDRYGIVETAENV